MTPPSEPDPAAENPYAAPRAALGADAVEDFDLAELVRAQALLNKAKLRAMIVRGCAGLCLLIATVNVITAVGLLFAGLPTVNVGVGRTLIPIESIVVPVLCGGHAAGLALLRVGLRRHSPTALLASIAAALIGVIWFGTAAFHAWQRLGTLSPLLILGLLAATLALGFFTSARTTALFSTEYRAALELERRYRRAIARAVRELADRQRSTTAKSAPRRRMF